MAGIMKTLWDESSELESEILSTHNLLVDDSRLSSGLDRLKDKSRHAGDDITITDESVKPSNADKSVKPSKKE